MTEMLNELISLMSLETIEKGLYRGQSQDLGFKNLYGGQALGQAVSAAQNTVDAAFVIHSLHSYFILPGDSNLPVVYQVDNVRDGRTVSTRRVRAIQDGREIFILMASFQLADDGFDHQDEMPECRPPEALTSFSDRFKESDTPSNELPITRAIDFRTETEYDWWEPKPAPGNRKFWMKAKGPLPDDARLHASLLAYASDYTFLVTALMPHGASGATPGFQIATIDHSVWFHRPFRFDDWLLFDMQSPSASGGRGLVKGRIYDQTGRLVASAMQEGVIRQR